MRSPTSQSSLQIIRADANDLRLIVGVRSKGRNMLKIVIATLITAILAGCQTATTQYLTKPEMVEVAGPYSHAPSGMMFPLTVGEFRRGSITRYDARGFDVSVGYNLYQLPKAVAATIYVYPSPSIVSIGSPANVVESARSTLCQNEYEARKREVLGAHPGANLLTEDVIGSPNNGVAASGKSATFEYEEIFAGVRQPIHSRLDMFCYIGGKWTVKYRFTYPAAFDAKQELDMFIEKVPWP